MSLPIISITLNADGSWTFTWTPTSATFYRVVLWGITIGSTTVPQYVWNKPNEYTDFPPPLEVAEESAVVLSEQFVPYLVMQWYGEPCDNYYVQQYDGTNWIPIRNIAEVGDWVYTFRTVILQDEHTYDYRVIAVDRLGNQSVPREFRRYVVCPPVPPDGKIRVEYAASNITIVSV